MVTEEWRPIPGHPGYEVRSLAERYGVSTGTIYLVRQRKVWAHV